MEYHNRNHCPLSDIRAVVIPARKHSPETILRYKLVYKNQEALRTLPYVLILPGGPGGNHSHYVSYDCLSEISNLVYYNPRGCGPSDKSDVSTYHMDNHIDDLHVIKQSLQVESVILLGKSYGAMCALGYALRYSKNVSKLILAAGAPSWQFMNAAREAVRARGTKSQQRMFQDLYNGNIKDDAHMDDYFRVMAPLYSWKKRNHLTTSTSLPALRFSFDAANEGFGKKFGKFNYTAQLSEIFCPTLILVGEEDWITNLEGSQKMAALISNSTLDVFKHADHAMELDVPELFFGRIMQFLSCV
jgi:proline iminopeptidase